MFKKKESIEARITNAKHPKTRHKPLQKKENAGFSLNSLTIAYDNSIVDARVIGEACPEYVEGFNRSLLHWFIFL
jgi:hypothetical protein